MARRARGRLVAGAVLSCGVHAACADRRHRLSEQGCRLRSENNRRAAIKRRQGKVSDQTARRRLEDLRAAVNAYHAEHTLSVVPKITLPPKAEGRHRWLTRNEAARLLGAAIGYVWDNERNSWKRKEDGKLLRRERWIIRRRHPAARFCLIGVYSARREETIRRTQWLATTTHPWMNLDAMVYQGKGALGRYSAGRGAWRGCRQAFATPHSSDVADAGRRRYVGGCWRAWNDGRAARGKLRSHHPEFQEEAAEAFGGRR